MNRREFLAISAASLAAVLTGGAQKEQSITGHPLLYSNDGYVTVNTLNGKNEARLFKGVTPRWSQDGTSIVYRVDKIGTIDGMIKPVETSIRVYDLESKVHTTVSDRGEFPHWVPNKEITYNEDGKTYAVDMNGKRRLLVDGLDPQWISNTSFLFKKNLSISSDSPLYLKDGSNVTTVLKAQRNAVVSPDGKRIAYSSRTMLSGGIYVCDIDGSNPTRIYIDYFGEETLNVDINWSPDSTTVVFSNIADIKNEDGIRTMEMQSYSYNLNTEKMAELGAMENITHVHMLSNGSYLFEQTLPTKIIINAEGKLAYLQLSPHAMSEDIFEHTGYDKKWLECDRLRIFNPVSNTNTVFSGNGVHFIR